MIDFDQSVIFKLKPIEEQKILKPIYQFLIDGEEIFSAFKTVRDQLIFTNKRVIAANVQGMTGSKVDYTSIPYSKIQTFSVETAGTLDLDCEIEFFISAVGKIKFEIKGNFDIISFNKLISQYVLN
ncbi:MAG: PH domain-containing protein [Microcoleaceae cyanobacterium]